ncbi:hypothetical protein [Desulfolutivibrio sulfoxidireducens]|uniref:hypothetical protein n=1 Tax=Desulfolutivibrio sulfoxidireducens TaxID=2773299 RepID=UPI00159D7AF5|nr:hypothetical protein [Desulfolutivibrio sulfoxidireducens]QLA16105.1 hypothetical protein GD605_08170 [Desulfolutivibrio sulfoxidireducens]
MNKEKSKTPTGKSLESSIGFFVGDIKAATRKMAFIRDGLSDEYHIEGAMGCLFHVQEKLEDLAEDLADKIKDIIELDALAAGESSFVPRWRGEIDLVRVFQEGREAGDLGMSFMARAAKKALEVYKAGHQMPKEPIPDESVVDTVVKSAKDDQEAGHE